METLEIPLTQGFVAIVDRDDATRVLAHEWQVLHGPHTTYARTSVPNTGHGPRQITRMLHVFLMGVPLVDHINGDGLDNRRANLRAATSMANAQNRRLFRNNTSGYKGVSWHPQRERWWAQIMADGKKRSLKLHDTPEEAARAYDVAARELHGDFATLNFPAPGERSAERIS
jgi:hypothetical protein